MRRTDIGRSSVSTRSAAYALTAVVGAAIGLSAPAVAVGEGTAYICATGGSVNPFCPWFTGQGPILSAVLGQNAPTSGRNAVIGMISGFLPPVRFEGEGLSQVDHVVFQEGNSGRSRVLVGIIAGAYSNGRSSGDPTQLNGENRLQVQAGGVLATAMGDGDFNPFNPFVDTTQGVAGEARAIVASVAASLSGADNNPQFETDLNGFARSMLIMADRTTALRFASAYPDINGDGSPDVVTADVIVLDIAEGGDLAGEGFLPRVADGIVFDYDVTVIAPTGDGADAVGVPQQQRQTFIFNRTLFAPASGYNVLAVGAQDFPAGTMSMGGSCPKEYRAQWFKSGRGTLRARNYAQFDPNEPTGFQEIPQARSGVGVVAPGTKLRIPDITAFNAFVRDENICDLLPEGGGGGGPGGETPDDLAESTRFATGYVAGAIALVQDAYKKLNAAQPTMFRLPRIPAVTMRAMVINSASRARADIACWTNTGEFYEGNPDRGAQPFGTCDPFTADSTQRSLDASVGGGLLDLVALHENFQGRAAAEGVLQQFATMDVPTTDRRIPYVRIPPGLGLNRGGAGFGGGPSGGLGDNDNSLRPPFPPPNIGPGGEIPADWPIRQIIPRGFRDFENPNTVFIRSALPVDSIGWDIARLGRGYVDYVITTLINAGDTFSATLTWNRTQQIDWPFVAPGSTEVLPPNIRDAELQLEYEDINLLLFFADSSGNPSFQIGRSATEWDNTELIYFDQSVDQGPGGMPVTGRYLMRVEWNQRRYDRFLRLPVADTEFGLAWRAITIEQLAPGGGLAFQSIPGDVNRDGAVDLADLSAVIQSFGQMDFNADANSDGIVNMADINLVLANFGRRAPESLASAE
ncbi:MAG: hypothetical protein KF684_07685 [Phycisphaeraceae bacterium]|nr:hypothetical protein [Phycisphaeraceae bacterium]